MSASLKHDGLREGIGRFDLLRLFEHTAKPAFGLSRTAIALIRHVIERTQDGDYKRGAICAVWTKVSTMADQLQLTSRSINNAERELEAAGFIKRTCGGNGARYGSRVDGVVIFAAGINLAPLIERYDELLEHSKTLALISQAINQCKSEIRNFHKQIRQIDADAAARADEILPRGRTSRIKKLHELKAIKANLLEVLEALLDSSGEKKISGASEENFSPNILNKHIHKSSRPQRIRATAKDSPRVRPKARPKAAPQITPNLIMAIASKEYQSIIQMYGGANWPSIVEVSSQLAINMGIDQSVWGRACESFGREIAALCVAIIHRNQARDKNHPYHAKQAQPCLLGMITKQRQGAFDLNALIGGTLANENMLEGARL